MKIVVIGTSNSVKKNGWLKAFRLDRFNDEIENLSIGANSSLLGITRALQEQDVIAAADVVILDFSVNDQNYIDHGFLTESDVALYLNAVLSYLAFLHKRVLLLFFPLQTYMQTIMPIKQIYYQMAEKWSVPIFDMDMAARSLYDLGIAMEILFSDPNHCSDVLAQIFGIQIARTIDQLESIGMINDHTYELFRYQSVSDLDRPLVWLKNSLLSLEAITLQLHDPLVLRSKGSLEALFVNVGEMGGIVRISNGRDTIVKNFYDTFGNKNKYCVTLKLLNRLIPDLGDGISIEIVDDSIPVTLKTMHEGEKTGKSLIQILGFVYRSDYEGNISESKMGKLTVLPNEPMKEQALSILHAMMDGMPIISGTTLRRIKQGGKVGMVADILQDIGHFMYNRKNFQGAAFFFEHTVRRKPNADAIRLVLAQIYMDLGKKELCNQTIKHISNPVLIATQQYNLVKRYVDEI